ncbi:MAG: LysR family transcriptional regulator [Oligoflexales bacterium]
MDWKNIQFDWNQARAFWATAKKGSFSKAAKALAVDHTTLGRQVSALEQKLKVTLLERFPRGINLTESGTEILEYVEKMAEAAADLSLVASGRSTSLEGCVCISAMEVMAHYILPHIAKKIRKQEPGITIEIISTDKSSDLRHREADIAIRNAKPKDSQLISKRLPEFAAYLYSTKDYLKDLSEDDPDRIASKAEFIGFPGGQEHVEYLKHLGISISMEQLTLISESLPVHWNLCKSGVGIGVMFDIIADHEANMTRVFPHQKPIAVSTYLLVHKEVNTNMRIRRVYNLLNSELTQYINDHSDFSISK